MLLNKTTKFLSLTASLWAHNRNQGLQNIKLNHYQRCYKHLSSLKDDIFDDTDLDDIFKVALKNMWFSEKKDYPFKAYWLCDAPTV